MIGTLEASDDRRREARESQNPATKNRKADKTDEDDANSEYIPRFPLKKRKLNPGKGKQQKTAIYCGTQCYCFLWKKTG